MPNIDSSIEAALNGAISNIEEAKEYMKTGDWADAWIALVAAAALVETVAKSAHRAMENM